MDQERHNRHLAVLKTINQALGQIACETGALMYREDIIRAHEGILMAIIALEEEDS